MERKIYQRLKQWKEEGGRTALLIDGARRVGKTHIALEFAKREYKTFLFIDFNRAGSAVKTLFNEGLEDLDTFFATLSALYNVRLHRRESLVVFDEVQLFPRARAAIKYLVEDGRFDYLETGSFMSIKRNVQDIVIPSEEEHVRMFPMDFEEFLWALGYETLMPFIQECFANKRALGQALHHKAMDLFRQYMIVGGMPQVVDNFARNRDFALADRVKRTILDLYRADIAKHAVGYETRVRSIFEEIPSQLQKHEKKFRLSSLKKEARFRDYKDALFWLDDAMIVNTCYNSTEPNVGLNLGSGRTTLKCYMADTGLLLSHAFDEKAIVSQGLYPQLFERLEINRGMLVENIVAQMLAASNHKLYFYSNSSREDAASRMEIDFLIASSTLSSRHNISPIEVKSGKNYTLSSLKKFMTKYAGMVRIPYVVHPRDMREEGGIVFLPYYMVPCL
ncbi:ATPase [Desulfovibrio sp. An276]|uniref:ATP-binding protein n=1 Tax=Desulfovibrio sp. An276 TaxID=1965618 RepID=UPI000B36D3B7|nr:AAA family ATPase [Desulfovibrio sp. An276]OUO51896.1 ATPase [Desulfovibrio sp. An276]